MNKFLYFLVFLAGLAITAIEMTVSRAIAPYFGASLLVWTNVIAVILAGLALGYYLGGKLADKYPHLKYLYYLILSSGIIFLFIPFLIKPLAQKIIFNPFSPQSSANFTILVASFFTIVILFLPPIALLATASPFIIKLISIQNKTPKNNSRAFATEGISANSQNNIGQISGQVFAIGTIGSIIGTFLPALFFIPFIGSKQTIIFFACLLIFISLIGLLKNKLKFFAVIIFIIPAFLSNLMPIKKTSGTILEKESLYQYIQIVENNSQKYLLYNEGAGFQTVQDSKNILSNAYYDYYTPLPHLLPPQKNLNVLILGLAAGNMNNQYHYFFDKKYNLKIDGVEIDKDVIEIAKKYFNLNQKDLTIYNQDARMFLKTTNKKYDLILMDVYKEYYLPEHMATKEFFSEIKEKLQPQGIFAANLISTSTSTKLFQSLNNTLAQNFKNVYYLHIPNHYNYLIYASDNNLDFSKLKKINNRELKTASKDFNNIKKFQPNQSQIFTDNRSPANLLTDIMLFQEFK